MKRYLALSLLTLATLGCDAMTAHTDVVARAGQHELTVDETVDLMAGATQIPAQADVVESIAGLWVDYTILAELAAEDSTLADVDLDPMLRPYVEQQLFLQWRDQVVSADTVIGDDELQSLYAEQAPGVRLRARHILLPLPDSGSEAQQDSVRALAEQVRQRAEAGEDFAALAREYSGDPGSAQQGGDLGWFQRGSMVGPFEEAAFALQPGEVSGVVESPFGLHIIKLQDRETPSLDSIGDSFRRQVINQRRQASLDEYVEGLREPLDIQVDGGAVDVARDLADDPARQLAGRAGSRELVTWDGGELTARELVYVLRRIPPQQRAQYATLDDERMSDLLREIATNELVLADAREQGFTVPEEEQDSIRGLIRTQLAQVVRQSGLAGEPQEGETEAEAVDRRVRSLLSGILAGQRNLLPLGALPFVLREEREWQVHETAFQEVVTRLQERRRSASETPAPPAVGPPATPADTGAAPEAPADTGAAQPEAPDTTG